MIELVRAATRMHTQIDWLDSWHSFSFGEHYDPTNTHHGLLLVSNDDRIAPGRGFATHGHRDMEIVTTATAGAGSRCSASCGARSRTTSCSSTSSRSSTCAPVPFARSRRFSVGITRFEE